MMLAAMASTRRRASEAASLRTPAWYALMVPESADPPEERDGERERRHLTLQPDRTQAFDHVGVRW